MRTCRRACDRRAPSIRTPPPRRGSEGANDVSGRTLAPALMPSQGRIRDALDGPRARTSRTRGTAAALTGSPAFRNADYFAFADRIVAALPTEWDADDGVYVARRNGSASRTNANLLLLHAVAALRGHSGATRQDERARRLVDRMTSPPMFLLPGPTPAHGRTVCWARQVNSSERDHVSLDSQVAEALAWAWKARRALGLTQAAARRIVSAVDRCARHPGWRFPSVLVNQFNWNAQLYASAATRHRTSRPHAARLPRASSLASPRASRGRRPACGCRTWDRATASTTPRTNPRRRG